MITTMTTLLILKKYTLKKITVLITVNTTTMLQSILKSSLKKQLTITIQLTTSMKIVILPLSFISKKTVKFIYTISCPQPVLKYTLIFISILVNSFPSAMG
jgi:hypothetical protein